MQEFGLLNLVLVLSTSVTVWTCSLMLDLCFFSYIKVKDDKDKAKLSLKGLKAQKKRRPQDTSGRLKQETTSLHRDVCSAGTDMDYSKNKTGLLKPI